MFYPRGGGQPGDTGTISWDGGSVEVTDTFKRDGALLHRCRRRICPGRAPRCTAAIDWERRHLLMRTHTALHVLSAIVWREFDAKVTGGNMEPGRARMDFELDAITIEFGRDVEERLNAALAEDHPMRCCSCPGPMPWPTPI